MPPNFDVFIISVAIVVGSAAFASLYRVHRALCTSEWVTHDAETRLSPLRCCYLPLAD